MRDEDAINIKEVINELKNSHPNIKKIGEFSGQDNRYGLTRHAYPEAQYVDIPEKSWNLLEPGKADYDLLLAANTWMYSTNPSLWFTNALARCKLLIIQDLIRAKRGPEELGDDGDSMRYCMLPQHVARYPGAFDLNVFKDRMVSFRTYDGPSGSGKDCYKFVIVLKGDLYEKKVVKKTSPSNVGDPVV